MPRISKSRLINFHIDLNSDRSSSTQYKRSYIGFVSFLACNTGTSCQVCPTTKLLANSRRHFLIDHQLIGNYIIIITCTLYLCIDTFQLGTEICWIVPTVMITSFTLKSITIFTDYIENTWHNPNSSTPNVLCCWSVPSSSLLHLLYSNYIMCLRITLYAL